MKLCSDQECFNDKTIDYSLQQYFSNLKPFASPKKITMISQIQTELNLSGSFLSEHLMHHIIIIKM